MARNGISMAMTLTVIGLIVLIVAFTVLSGFSNVIGGFSSVTEDKQKKYGQNLKTATDRAGGTGDWSENPASDSGSAEDTQSTEGTDTGQPSGEQVVPDGGTYEAIT